MSWGLFSHSPFPRLTHTLYTLFLPTPYSWATLSTASLPETPSDSRRLER